MALASSMISVARGVPALAYNLIGHGCHFDINHIDVYLNLNMSGDSDGPTATATADAAMYWRHANTDAPDLWPYWPAPPYAGKGDLDIRRYGNAASTNSGYLSTSGPGAFPAPSCGSTKWSSRPNIWVNDDLIVAREQAGHASYNVSTVAHEAGHALGLDHNEGTRCSVMPLMDSDAADTNYCGIYKPTSDERAGVNKIYN